MLYRKVLSIRFVFIRFFESTLLFFLPRKIYMRRAKSAKAHGNAITAFITDQRNYAVLALKSNVAEILTRLYHVGVKLPGKELSLHPFVATHFKQRVTKAIFFCKIIDAGV